MKGKWLWIVISANLVVLLALVFIYPHWMVAPGPLVAGHSELATDCFACHAPLRGATADRCVACHKLTDIGLRTTKGATLVSDKRIKASFHQALNDDNCMACHSDHAGPKLTQRSRKPFSHAMLRSDTSSRCESCHTAPENELHKTVSAGCEQCHKTQAWKPATFEHDKFFALDGDHNAPCATCHTGKTFSTYTCYGCHEHTRGNVLAQHREEGVAGNLDNCVRCHRSAEGEGEGEGEGKAAGDRGQGGREKD